MIEKAFDPSLNKEGSAKDAIKGKIYQCLYCKTKMHICQQRHFARFPDAPEHSNRMCISMVAKPPQIVVHQIKQTHRDDIFGQIMHSHDPLDHQEPPDSVPPPPLPPDGPDVPLRPNFPTIETDQLKNIPALEPIVQLIREYDLDHLNPQDYNLNDLGLTNNDIEQLSEHIANPDMALLTDQDIIVLEALVKEAGNRLDRREEHPIRTLRQFDDLGLIFLLPRTELADCRLKDLFLSYYYREYCSYFAGNYKRLGGRILYCRFEPIRQLDDTNRPSLRLKMYWSVPEKTNVTLYINFSDIDGHTARERYEFFVQRMFEQKMMANGTMAWVPRGATSAEIKREAFDALVFGQWEYVERYDKKKNSCHYISLRTQYLNSQQFLFTHGYNVRPV